MYLPSRIGFVACISLLQFYRPSVAETQCLFEDSCKCDMTDGSGRVNLHSLALEGITLDDSAFTATGDDGWKYKYNPCNGFRLSLYSNLAIAQTDQFETSGYDLGVQTSALFNYTTANGLSIHYKAADGVRSSRVLLICQPAVNADMFEFVGELIILEYDFILSSHCACPGKCDDDGPIGPIPTVPPGGTDVSCDFIDSCTCKMSDGSGQVNLHGPALEAQSLSDSAYTVDGGGGWWYKYNPCNGFTSAGFTDLAILQSSSPYGYTGYDLGVQSSAYFNFTESSSLSIHYTAFDQLRSSRVLLICEPGTNEHHLSFIGELVTTEYDFVFTSPCACPGVCDNDGVIGEQPTPTPSTGGPTCVYKDSCTCKMSDGSGEVNLHSLALEGSSLYDSAFSVIGGDDWIYRYNPCNGFWLQSYSNLAIGQEHETGSWGNDLGVQSSAFFDVTGTSLAIHYKSADGVRSSRVLLVCQPEVNSNTFEYVGELIILEYEFILTSPCACPGKCNDNGLLVPLPTLPPDGGGDKTCNYIDTCTCDMSDGSGEVNLHALSLQGSNLYDSAFTESGPSGWYYKYNPCDGFYFTTYYDVAIAQSSDYYGNGYGYELGSQSSAAFSYAESSGLTIKYVSTDGLRKSRVLLICEPGSSEHKFEFIGELVTLEYEFILTTPCACAGACDDNGVIGEPPSGTHCQAVDSCTCDMSDGSGRINLRSLGLKGDSLTEAAFTADGLDGWLYKYNPCTEFTVVYYYGLAVAQVNFHGTAGHDLGVQSSAKFQYSSINGLSIHYDSNDRVRMSRVLLVCDRYATEAVFDIVGELTVLEYDFILKSACACPGGCDDYGVANSIATQSPPDGNGGQFPDDVNVNVQQSGNSDSSANTWTYVGGTSIALILHDLFLIVTIALVVILVKQTAWCQPGSDDKTNPYSRMKDAVTGQNSV